MYVRRPPRACERHDLIPRCPASCSLYLRRRHNVLRYPARRRACRRVRGTVGPPGFDRCMVAIWARTDANSGDAAMRTPTPEDNGDGGSTDDGRAVTPLPVWCGSTCGRRPSTRLYFITAASPKLLHRYSGARPFRPRTASIGRPRGALFVKPRAARQPAHRRMSSAHRQVPCPQFPAQFYRRESIDTGRTGRPDGAPALAMPPALSGPHRLLLPLSLSLVPPVLGVRDLDIRYVPLCEILSLPPLAHTRADLSRPNVFHYESIMQLMQRRRHRRRGARRNSCRCRCRCWPFTFHAPRHLSRTSTR